MIKKQTHFSRTSDFQDYPPENSFHFLFGVYTKSLLALIDPFRYLFYVVIPEIVQLFTLWTVFKIAFWFFMGDLT